MNSENTEKPRVDEVTGGANMKNGGYLDLWKSDYYANEKTICIAMGKTLVEANNTRVHLTPEEATGIRNRINNILRSFGDFEEEEEE